MERKIYIMENLGCANCAAKMEAKFNALPEVEEATITFATKQLRLTAEDPDSLIEKLTEIAQTVEHEVVIKPRDGHHHEPSHEQHHGCGCGHHHDHEHECGCGHHGHDHACSCGHHHDDAHECSCGHHHGHEHECGCGCHHDDGYDHHQEEHHHHDQGSDDKKTILLGAGLFVVGLVLNWIGLDIGGALAFVLGYIILGREVLTTALKNLTKGHVFDENFLMSIATLGAFAIGEFPEAVGVMLFYRVGEYFEHRAVERSRSQIMEAIDLRPETVTLVEPESFRIIPAAEAQVGDVLLIRPGDRIPLDGRVITGESRIDTSPVTGEPVPVRVAWNSDLISGCINTTGQLTMVVDKPLSESMVTRILDSVENAAASKPKIDRFITRFARIYTPIVVALAAAVAIIPSVVTGDWNYWVYTALSFLVMSCPCALVLSVPLAFFSGIGVGSKQGILFKGGASIEALSGIKAVVMDKTGTVTKGEFKVQQIAGGLDVLKLCASCEQQSTHPIAQSIVAAAKERKMELFTPDSLEEIPGRGIRAKVDGKTILCGNEQFLEENNLRFDPVSGYGTHVLVAVDTRFVGYINIADTIKDGAADAVRCLNREGLHTVMLTGDGIESARAVATEVGIREVHAKLLPQQKLVKLQRVREEKGAVMFVGDGINDAPVLAGADVGAAMGSGADAAIEAADVVFMTSDVRAVPESLEIARQTSRIAWQNVVFALAIKFFVMALGLMGYASMWMAVFADSGVAMLCVLNSIRLLYRKK